jgi:opacity protein-like surface antigen
LPKPESLLFARSACRCAFAFFLACLSTPFAAVAQSAPDNSAFTRVNSFGIFSAYSNDSSHILLGYAEQRKLLDFGASYNRRILDGRRVDWQLSAELMPVALESDPLSETVVRQILPEPASATFYGDPLISCSPQVVAYKFIDPKGVVHTGTETSFCRHRQWTIGEAMSPVGFQWNFRAREKVQPFLDWHGGFMYSTKPIPIDFAGSFNFTVDAGAGVEFYRARHQSIRVEYRYHHISNANSATYNPGIDSGVLQLTYAFGR